MRVLRFENEAEDLLHYLKDTGLHPGLEGKLGRAGDDEIVIEAGGASHSVTRSVAETVSVVADPSPPLRTALPDQLVLGKERYGRWLGACFARHGERVSCVPPRPDRPTWPDQRPPRCPRGRELLSGRAIDRCAARACGKRPPGPRGPR